MKEKNLYLFLEVIDRNGSAKFLERKGMSFLQIAKNIEIALSSELIKYEGEILVLTEKGRESLSGLAKEYKRTNKQEWIEEENRSKIPTIDKNDIFLPNQNELNF